MTTPPESAQNPHNELHELKRLLRLTELQKRLIAELASSKTLPTSKRIDPHWSVSESMIRLQSVMIVLQRRVLDEGDDVLEAASVYSQLTGTHIELIKTMQGLGERKT